MWRPVMGMLVFDLISAMLIALAKNALEEGLNRLVLITLRQLVATVFLAPIAYFKERSTRPKLTLDISVYIFFSAVFGAAHSQYTVDREARISVDSHQEAGDRHGLVCSKLDIIIFSLQLSQQSVSSICKIDKNGRKRPSTTFPRGANTKSIFLCMHLTVTHGIVASGVGYLIVTWCVEKKGPAFTAAFTPIIQIMVAFIDFFFVHEQIYLGSVLGSVLMILGLSSAVGKKEGCLCMLY